MRTKLTKNRINTYLKKSGFENNMERYNEMEHTSMLYFYGDNKEYGSNQFNIMISGSDDIVLDKIESIFNDMLKDGWTNIRCEVYKRYYIQSRTCRPLLLDKSMMVYEYRYI